MAIAVNKFSAGAAMSAVGKTGTQTQIFIPIPRVFVKTTPDSTTAAVLPADKINGDATAATGWTDLGTVKGAVKVGYEKKTKEIRTGPDEYIRMVYANQKGCTLEFELSQLDDVVLETISGLTSSTLTGSVTAYGLGQEDLSNRALLFVCQSKLDGKEHQYYTPSAFLNFTFNEAADGMALKVSAFCMPFSVSGALSDTEMYLAHIIHP